MATAVTLSDSQRATLRYAQLDQVDTQLQHLAAEVGELRDMRNEDRRRRVVTGDVLSGVRLVRDDLDALEALLREDVVQEGESN